MAKEWRIHSHDAQRIGLLERSVGVPAVLARLLVCRGLTEPAAARDFLQAKLSQLRDPAELPGVTQAVGRIGEAIRRRERIVVYGDYDVDGMTGASLLMTCLKLLGADAGYYLPHRIEEGYGLNHEAIKTLAGQGAKLVVTVDCGIGSVEHAQTARQLGLELIVTDHHEPGPELPEAAAIVHPRLPGERYPFAGLSGAGVAFKLAWALCQQASGAKKVGEPMRNFLLSALGLAALGTVADVVPLVDENRVLVQHGLAALKERPGLGLAALLRLTKLDQKPRLDGDDIGFTLAPRLNAAGRLGQGQLAVELMTTLSKERAAALAEYLDELNNSRQSLERSIYLSANKQAQERFDVDGDAALVLAERGWHPGVIGIVAGRLAEKFHRPVILIALDEVGVKPGVGSGRSVAGFDLHQALNVTSHHLLSHGGHAAAAGLKIEEAKLDHFRADFCEYASATITARQKVAELWIDAEVSFGELSLSTVGQIERLAPFGQANPRPMLCATGVTLAGPPKRIGGGERHLALKLVQHGVPMRAVAFGGGEWADEMAAVAGPLAVAFRPIINEFGGRRSVEAQIADWRAASRPTAVGAMPPARPVVADVGTTTSE
ncbi:MAG TPA: single-stranded-DNA-specific exonuclease RecJ [Pirellulales bacterium]|nr:single-stranded-DNA-specific exonuclease RecJ [Pirellulales bacterium]